MNVVSSSLISAAGYAQFPHCSGRIENGALAATGGYSQKILLVAGGLQVRDAEQRLSRRAWLRMHSSRPAGPGAWPGCRSPSPEGSGVGEQPVGRAGGVHLGAAPGLML